MNINLPKNTKFPGKNPAYYIPRISAWAITRRGLLLSSPVVINRTVVPLYSLHKKSSTKFAWHLLGSIETGYLCIPTI